MGIFKKNYVVRTELAADEVTLLFAHELVSYIQAREQELTNNASFWVLEVSDGFDCTHEFKRVNRQTSEFIASKINITSDHESTRIEITTKYTAQFYLGWLTWIFVFFFISWVLPLMLPVALIGLLFPFISFKL